MSRVLRFSAACALVALAPLLAGCDETPGVPDPFGTPPAISGIDLTPAEVDDTSGNATVALAPVLTLDVTGGDGDITVRAFVRGLDGGALVAEAEQTGGAGGFELRPSFEVPRGAIGRYEITVTTEDASGRVGDRASAVLVFTSPSLGGPTITSTSASPSPVPRPASGSQTVTLSADVDDPDGPANVAYVELRQGGETLFRFRDDGTGGDGTPGDGRFALSLAIGSTTPTGTFVFDAVAVDRHGISSVPVEVTFTVQ
ncbi:MAG: hypothetical protein AAF791_10995 [Bacteroidota bacterium]